MSTIVSRFRKDYNHISNNKIISSLNAPLHPNTHTSKASPPSSAPAHYSSSPAPRTAPASVSHHLATASKSVRPAPAADCDAPHHKLLATRLDPHGSRRTAPRLAPDRQPLAHAPAISARIAPAATCDGINAKAAACRTHCCAPDATRCAKRVDRRPHG